MKARALLIAAVVAVGLTVGGTATATASTGHHEHKNSASAKAADRQAERKAERKAQREADRNTATPASQSPAKTNTATPCTVTSTKPVRTGTGATADVTNTCTHPKTLTVSVQAQIPGPWVANGCKTHPGVCHLITRYDVTVQPGTHPLAIPFQGCRIQVDIKDGNRLVRAAQFGEVGCQTRTSNHHPGTHHSGRHHPVTTPGHPDKPVIGTAIRLTKADVVKPAAPAGLPVTGAFGVPQYLTLGGLSILAAIALLVFVPRKRKATA